MKTSNYITIAYFIFLFGGVLTLFIAAKNNPEAGIEARSFLGTKELGHFSVVVNESTEMLILKHTERSRLLTTYNEGEPILFAPHEIRNDTLFILKDPKSNYQFVQVECSGAKSILSKAETTIRIDNSLSDTITIKLKKAKLFFLTSNDRTSLLTLIADQSEAQIHANIDNFRIQANQTTINGNNSFSSVSGSLKNYSMFVGRSVNHISLDADSTSTYRLN